MQSYFINKYKSQMEAKVSAYMTGEIQVPVLIHKTRSFPKETAGGTKHPPLLEPTCLNILALKVISAVTQRVK